LSDDDRLIDLSQTAWERARNNIRSQQVRDPLLLETYKGLIY